MIKSFQLSDGALHAVERLDAQVMLFSNPDAAERDLLHSHFKLDEHALASALDPDEVSRIEFHPDNLFLIWKRPENYSGADSLAFEVSSCGEIYSTVFSGLIDARGNLMNNSMNNLLRKLTLINVVFLPLNLIASIGGMSEFSMMTAGTPWWVSYPLFLTAMMLGAGVMVLGLRRLAK